MNEFIPLDEFTRITRRWWIIAMCMFLGGLVAYGFHQANPPLYEASATMMATIDQTTFPFREVQVDLLQYNEDMALGTVEGVLRSTDVTQALFAAVQPYGISLDAAQLNQSSTIERRNDLWEVRFRSPDPLIAKTVVNLWVGIGYDAMLLAQSEGRVPAFVILSSPNPAYLPIEPIIYQRANLLLAGSLAGMIIGVLLNIMLAQSPTSPARQQHA